MYLSTFIPTLVFLVRKCLDIGSCNHVYLHAAACSGLINLAQESVLRWQQTVPRIQYTHSPFWSTMLLRRADLTLLHQAYAKLHGTYESINGGSVGEALVDLTGGSCQKILFASGDWLLDRAIDRSSDRAIGRLIQSSRRNSGDKYFTCFECPSQSPPIFIT